MAKAYLIDMDGVLIKGKKLIPGAAEFIRRLREEGTPFLILTNNSRLRPQDFSSHFEKNGLDVAAESFFTSAMATANFLHQQQPKGTAFVIGESGLIEALQKVGYALDGPSNDYVVMGETFSYSFKRITTAINLVAAGSRFIATNPDVVGPSEKGIEPACGAVAAMVTAATGVKPYFVGKPNPYMVRAALRRLGSHSEDNVMIGDRMDTDIMGGVESGMETILVLSGLTNREDVNSYPYRPDRIVESVAEIERI